MQCMQNYQPTKQINEIETKLQDRCQSTLLILEGKGGHTYNSWLNTMKIFIPISEIL